MVLLGSEIVVYNSRGDMHIIASGVLKEGNSCLQKALPDILKEIVTEKDQLCRILIDWRKFYIVTEPITEAEESPLVKRKYSFHSYLLQLDEI